MEQAVNSFIKGLQSDTHPMTQGNETLSDALNATIITSSGNEFILQNDMGNRRVNNAFLPSGYEPVGIKEYGGIIYIAAYNPITNKSQIGSFPSPQRKINDPENNSGEFNFENFDFSTKTQNIEHSSNLENIWVLKNDSFLIPLTKDTSLRAGDKFSIYSEDSENLQSKGLYSDDMIIRDIRDNLTNYNNVDSEEMKAISPKNKKYTIAVGVLNSQNQFVDITKTLHRVYTTEGENKGKYIKYQETVSDIYKFNDGYFISPSNPNIDNVETQADNNLILSRQKVALNTYSYKLIGPLYLKISLNHIVGFDYDIRGIYNKENNTATLFIDGYITYNCPDGVQQYDNSGDINYKSYQEGKVGMNGFDLLDNNFVAMNNNKLYLAKFVKRHKEEEVTYGKCTYDPITNLYRVKITKQFNDVIPNYYPTLNVSELSTIYEYILGVSLNTPSKGAESRTTPTEESSDYDIWKSYDIVNQKYRGHLYLENLSIKNTIDLAKLGTGEIKLIGWKFKNELKENGELKKTDISYSFSKYPRSNEIFVNLRLEFVNVADPTDYFCYPEAPFGSNDDVSEILTKGTITINWETETYKPKPRQVYGVTYTYGVYSDKTIKIYDEYGNLRADKVENLVKVTEDSQNSRSSRGMSRGINMSGEDTYVPLDNNIYTGPYTIDREKTSDIPKIPIPQIDDTKNSLVKPIDINEIHIPQVITETQEISQYNLWYISTELFNTFYSNGDIVNFCTVVTNPEMEGYNEGFAEKMNIVCKAEFEGNIKNETYTEQTGNIVSQDKNINYTVTTTNNISVKKENVIIKITDEQNYPEWIKPNASDIEFNQAFIVIENNGNENTTEINDLNKNTIKEKLKNKIENYTKSGIDKLEEDLFDISRVISSNELKVTIKNKDILLGKGTSKLDVKDVFAPLSSMISLFLPKNEGFCAPIVNGDFGNDGNTSFYDLIVNYPEEKVNEYPSDDDPWEYNGETYSKRKGVGSVIFTYRNDDLDKEIINQSLVCTYLNVAGLLYSGEDESGLRISNKDLTNDQINQIEYAYNNLFYSEFFSNITKQNCKYFSRIFWKVKLSDNDYGWAMFKNPIIDSNKESITKNDIINLFKYDYIYCAYPKKDDIILYGPNQYIYNNNYNFNVTLKAGYKFKQINNIAIPYKIGNLEFKYVGDKNEDYTISLGNVTLKSETSFYDRVNNIQNIIQNGVDSIYANGNEIIFKDSEGGDLIPSNVYYLENKELKKLNSNSFTIDTTTINNESYNQLLLYTNGVEESSPNYKYYAYKNGGQYSLLKFDNIRLVKDSICK